MDCGRCNRKNIYSATQPGGGDNPWLCSWCYGKHKKTARIARKLAKSKTKK